MYTAPHLAALSSLIAHDSEAGALHHRQLQMLALACIAGAAPLTVGAAAAELGISPGTASRDATRLVERGFVTRSDKPADRRIALLIPTKSGRALDARVRAHVETCNQ